MSNLNFTPAVPMGTTKLVGFDVAMAGGERTYQAGGLPVSTAQASADAAVLAAAIQRANHTGTQAAASISDFDSVARAQVEAELVAGTNITITPAGSGATRTLTISAVGGGGATNLSTTAAPTTVTIVSDTGTDATIAAADGTNAGVFLPAEKTKLSGIAAGATVNSSDATLLARANHTGTQSADTLTDGTTNKAFLATERTHLSAITGTNTGDQTITLTSDVTGSGTGSFAATIAANAVSNSKLAQVATQTFKGRTTAGTGNPEDLTVAQTQSLLGTSGTNTGDETTSTIKTKLSITTLSGSNTGDQTISITGDVTASGSTGALTAAVTKINGTSLAGLATGILKNTTTTGVPSIAVAGDFPTLNQNTSGTAANLSGTPALPNGTAATTQATGDSTTKLSTTAFVQAQIAATPYGMKNRIINSGMQVSQRGYVNAVNSAYTYGGCDRMCTSVNGLTSGSIRQMSGGVSSGVSGYSHAVLCTTSGASSVLHQTRIESKDTIDLNGKTVTVSCKVYQDTGTAIDVYISLGKPTTTIDAFSALSLLANANISLPTGVLTTVTLTYTLGSTEASLGLFAGVVYTLPSPVTSKYFTVTDWQLELGSTAMPFEHRPYGLELALCQRYLPVLNFAGYGYTGQAYSASASRTWVAFPVPARVAPTGCSALTGLTASAANLATAGGTPTFSSATPNGASIDVSGASGLVAGNASVLQGSATVYFNGCEL